MLTAGKPIVDVVKIPDFKAQFMLLLEGQMVMNGLAHHVAVLGSNVAVELKITRNSLMFFELAGKAC